MKVLVVDDEPQIVRALRTALRAHGHDIAVASNGEEALAQVGATAPDLMILDLGLPDMDGKEIIRELRGWSDIPVIVLSVREAQGEKVAALDAGADDYVTKPFGVPELLARMRATRRRATPEPAHPVLRFGDLAIDLSRQLVALRGDPLHLTRTQYKLLEAMATHPGKLLTHRWLLQRVWGHQYGAESNYLRVYVQQLRRKLEDAAASPTYIVTEPGVGYRWMPEPDA